MKQKTIITIAVSWVIFLVVCASVAVYAKNNRNDDPEPRADIKNEQNQTGEDTGEENSEDGSTEDENAANTLEKDQYPEVNELVKNVLDAMVACDIDTLKTLDLNQDAYQSDEELKRAAELVKGYENIVCYTKKGLLDDTYVVFAMVDMKIADIDTLAPGLYQFYVVKDTDGKYKVNTDDDLDAEVSNYISNIKNEDDVLELTDTVNTKLQEAAASDEKLKALLNN